MVPHSSRLEGFADPVEENDGVVVSIDRLALPERGVTPEPIEEAIEAWHRIGRVGHQDAKPFAARVGVLPDRFQGETHLFETARFKGVSRSV